MARATTRALRPGRLAQRLSALAGAVLFFAGSAPPILAQTPVAQYAAATGPVGVALDTVGGVTYLYVADEAHGNVLKLNASTGATVATFGSGSQGSAPGQFGRPYGVAVDPASHDLYVTERLNGRVQRINSTTGASVLAWGTNDAAFNSAGQNTNAPNPTSPQGHFQEPVGIAADAAGNVYVVDHGNNRVQKFLVHQVGGTWTADPVTLWGTTGSGNGQFDHPYGAALDAAGNVWVADGLNGRVQVFTSAGTYASTVGSKGTGNGQFVIATGVGFDPTGALYVTSTNSDPQATSAADINNQWVSKFTVSGTNGTFASRFGGTYGSNPGEFKLPFSVAVDAANKAYVSDYYNSRVQVMDLAAAPGGTTGPTVTAFTVGSSTATTVTFQLTFSAPVTGVDATDFTVTPSAGVTAAVGTVSGTGATYTIPVTYSGTTGSLQLALKTSGTGIMDANGHDLTSGGTTSASFTIPPSGGTPDTTPPTVANFTVGGSSATTVTFQLVFSEPVTGVDAADFTAVTTGGATAAIGVVTGSGTIFSIPVTFTGTGTVQLNLNATGTGIVDASGNALATGATSATYTIASNPGGGGTAGVTVVSATVPADGTYRAGDALVFKLRFSAPVTVKLGAGGNEDDDAGKNKPGDDDEEDEQGDEGVPYITWTAVAASGGSTDSGHAKYQSGSGTTELTFKYQVHGNDSAPAGIVLGTSVTVPASGSITDPAGLAVTPLPVSWPQNPLPGVILVPANISNPGADHRAGNPGANGGGNGHGKHKAAGLINLSSRLHVKGGDASRAVAVGFVVAGGSPQSVLVRAIGPALRGYGILDALDEPSLTIQSSGGQILATNKGWNNDATVAAVSQRVGAFTLAPGSHDSATVLTLAPGAYTATVGGAHGNGVALIEVYDANAADAGDPQLVNISTRGFVEANANLIAGFVVRGTEPKRVLVRAVGPALAAFGVTDTLADPNLEVHDSTGAVVARNNDWSTALPIDAAHPAATAADVIAANSAAGAFPLSSGSKDSAVVVTLNPGAYTAVVAGAGASSGAVLVEVYELPTP